MELSGMWNEMIRDLKKRMTVGQIVKGLAYYDGFFDDNKLDYGNLPWEELEKYIKEL